jgi:hypothetical protein
MTDKIKKIIAREGLIILGLGIPVLLCFLIAILLRPHPYADIFIYISLLLIISYVGLLIFRYVRWAPMRGYYADNNPDLQNIFAGHTKTVIIIVAIVIVMLMAIILFPNLAVKVASFGR